MDWTQTSSVPQAQPPSPMTGLWLLFAFFVMGCGSSTGLKVGPPSDASVTDDGEEDGATDGAPRDTTTGFPDTSIIRVDSGPPFVVPPQPVDPTCIEVPTEGPVELSVRARIESADVLFLIDRTASMEQEIDEIRDQLSTVLIPQLQALVGSLAMGVAVFDEVPYPPFGSWGGRTVNTLAPLSTETRRTLNALENMTVGGGTAADPPEAAVPALHTLFRDRAGCGFPGALCLRPDVVPVVLLFTDAALHNGPGGDLPYTPPPIPREDVGPLPPTPPTYEEMLVPVRARGARVLGLYSGASRPDTAIRHLRQLATDTGALGPDGGPVFFDIGERGERVGEGVAATVGSLFSSAPIGEIRAAVRDVPGDEVDAASWVSAVVPSRVLPPTGATIALDAFLDVRPGSVVIFGLEVDAPIETPVGVYPIEFEAVDGVGEVLDNRIVRLVIPGPGVSCDEP